MSESQLMLGKSNWACSSLDKISLKVGCGFYGLFHGSTQVFQREQG